jgi:hypothetical protein
VIKQPAPEKLPRNLTAMQPGDPWSKAGCISRQFCVLACCKSAKAAGSHEGAKTQLLGVRVTMKSADPSHGSSSSTSLCFWTNFVGKSLF